MNKVDQAQNNQEITMISGQEQFDEQVNSSVELDAHPYDIGICTLIEGIEELMIGQKLETKLPYLFYAKYFFDLLVKNQYGHPSNIDFSLDPLVQVARNFLNQEFLDSSPQVLASPNVLQYLQTSSAVPFLSFKTIYLHFQVLQFVRAKYGEDAHNLVATTLAFALTKSQTFNLDSLTFIWGCLEYLSCIKNWGIIANAHCSIKATQLVYGKQIFCSILNSVMEYVSTDGS